MKKYHQLFLIILSIISLILFLIYRREYNRLHYVLEVFNFFGQPCNISDLQLTEKILDKYDWGPEPLWREVEGIYLYSSFHVDDGEIHTIVSTKKPADTTNYCWVWFEGKTKPLMGKFSNFQLSQKDRILDAPYLYTCRFTPNSRAPFAVSYARNGKTKLKKLMLVKTYPPQPTFNTTICVLPSVYSKKHLIEFISYHKILGIDSFIFYNQDVPYNFAKLITNLSTRLGFQATFYDWNFPKPESTASRRIVETDCTKRTLHKNTYVIILEMDEYIVPAENYLFTTFMKRLNLQVPRLTMPSRIFCINELDENRPFIMQNLKISSDRGSFAREIIQNSVGHNPLLLFQGAEDLVVINKYIECFDTSDKTKKDKTISKYFTDLTRSTLFQLFIHGQI